MRNRIVKTIFGGIICPACNEPLNIEFEEENKDNEFGSFYSQRYNPLKECEEFNDLLNSKMTAIENGQLSLDDFRLWSQQYRRE